MNIFEEVFLLIFCLVGAQLISLFALTTGRLGPEWPVIEWVPASDDDNTGPVSLSRCYSHYTNYQGYCSVGLTHSHWQSWRGRGVLAGKSSALGNI